MEMKEKVEKIKALVAELSAFIGGDIYSIELRCYGEPRILHARRPSAEVIGKASVEWSLFEKRKQYHAEALVDGIVHAWCEDAKLYTFGIKGADPEEADYYKAFVPESEDPQTFVEEQTGDRVLTYWCSDPEAVAEQTAWLKSLHERRKSDDSV